LSHRSSDSGSGIHLTLEGPRMTHCPLSETLAFLSLYVPRHCKLLSMPSSCSAFVILTSLHRRLKMRQSS
jgi:hypothetical protein